MPWTVNCWTVKRSMLTIGATAIVLTLLGSAVASADAPDQESIEGEIQGLLDAQSQAWSAGDLEAFCSVYADDVVFVSPSGLTKGRQEVLERYRKRYPDKGAMGNLTLEILEVRVAETAVDSSSPSTSPSPSISASAVGRWTLSYPDREAVTGLTLLVFHRDEGGSWRIVQDASM